jgi:hypothetical protein
MTDRVYDNCMSQISERLNEVQDLVGDTTRELLEERPEQVKEALEQARLKIVGAIALAEWAERLKANRRTG